MSSNPIKPIPTPIPIWAPRLSPLEELTTASDAGLGVGEGDGVDIEFPVGPGLPPVELMEPVICFNLPDQVLANEFAGFDDMVRSDGAMGVIWVGPELGPGA